MSCVFLGHPKVEKHKEAWKMLMFDELGKVLFLLCQYLWNTDSISWANTKGDRSFEEGKR